jgi:hypothetical protein
MYVQILIPTAYILMRGMYFTSKSISSSCVACCSRHLLFFQVYSCILFHNVSHFMDYYGTASIMDGIHQMNTDSVTV